jgi:hypothetical protein
LKKARSAAAQTSYTNALLGLIAQSGEWLLGKVANLGNTSESTPEHGDSAQPLRSISNARRTNSQPLLKRQLGYRDDEGNLRHGGPLACLEVVATLFAARFEPRRVLELVKARAPRHDEA